MAVSEEYKRGVEEQIAELERSTLTSCAAGKPSSENRTLPAASGGTSLSRSCSETHRTWTSIAGFFGRLTRPAIRFNDATD